MIRWHILLSGFMFVLILLVLAPPVSAQKECYDSKGNPVDCPPTKEKPTPAGGQPDQQKQTTAPEPTFTLTATATSTASLTPTPTATRSPVPTESTSPTPSSTATPRSGLPILGNINADGQSCNPPAVVNLGIGTALLVAGAIIRRVFGSAYWSPGTSYADAASSRDVQGVLVGGNERGNRMVAPLVDGGYERLRHFLGGRFPSSFGAASAAMGGILIPASLAEMAGILPCSWWPATAGISAAAGIGVSLMSVLRERIIGQAGGRVGLSNVAGVRITPSDMPGPSAKPDSVDDVRLER